MSKVIFDIETAGQKWEELDETSQRYLMRFAKTRAEKKLERQRLALYPLTAEIVCVGMLNPDTNKGAVYYRALSFKEDRRFEDGGLSYIPGSEKEILEKFWQAMRYYR